MVEIGATQARRQVLDRSRADQCDRFDVDSVRRPGLEVEQFNGATQVSRQQSGERAPHDAASLDDIVPALGRELATLDHRTPRLLAGGKSDRQIAVLERSVDRTQPWP